MAHQFGRLKMTLFWLHGFEEPFYNRENYQSLACPTLFKEGRTQFVGLLCCLILIRHASCVMRDASGNGK
jgi:hypothetical protein